MSTYEREMLAIMFAIKHWEHYLLSRHFIIKTYHRSLKYLLEKRVSTSAQHVQLSKLQPFDYVIEYKQGYENRVADALSRLSSRSIMLIIFQVLQIS